MNTFLTDDEVRDVVRVGGHHFEKSLAGYGNGVVSARTSSTSWCNVPKCEEDIVMRRLKAKIVGCLDAGRGPLPQTYTEHLQVLRYEPGQFYKQHHDQVTVRARIRVRVQVRARVRVRARARVR